MPPRQLLASALLAALVSPLAHAEDAVDIDRVTVSASTSRIPDSDAALPNTITVIDQQQLQQQLALTQDISQVLANLIPSFSPSRQKLTNGGETLRGRKPLYLVDGVPQSTPLREGGRDGHTIDPAMIERIEVIHGANALQGLGASGGIINIITKRAPRQDGESFQDVNVAASTRAAERKRQHRLPRARTCSARAVARSTSSAAPPTPAKACTTTATATRSPSTTCRAT